MKTELKVSRLQPEELEQIRPLLVDLHLEEQPYFEDHRQLNRFEVDSFLGRIQSHFQGENVVFAVHNDASQLVGFCWVVLFDPGTGLEGEVAELYITDEYRGQGVGEVLVQQAMELFKERGVTLGYVWTREENEAAFRLYRRAGFEPGRQLVLTWYPVSSTT